MGDNQLAEVSTSVRVRLYQLTMLNRSNRAARINVQTHAYGPLVKVGLTIGIVCRTAHHRHHRHTSKGDDPNVGYTLVAILCKTGIKVINASIMAMSLRPPRLCSPANTLETCRRTSEAVIFTPLDLI